MSDTSLSHRFLTDWPAAPAPAMGMSYDQPHRQAMLLAVGRQQLEAQRAAATAIVQSNIVAADVIAQEINEQTLSLEASLQEYSAQITTAISDAADQIEATVGLLGDRLCVHLGEIKWQLAQQGKTLDAILHTLRENRSNEARQLVDQGVRHYVHRQYERAEERFRKALDQDTTDYQVLMNLAYIEVQKGRSREALELFADALRLPGQLDDHSKRTTLLAIARVHYAVGDYGNAFINANVACDLLKEGPAEDTFTLGTYAALAGKLAESVQYLDQAIHQRATLFAKAATDPNLDGSREVIFSLLSRLSVDARAKFESALQDARDLLTAAAQHEHSSMCLKEIELARHALDSISAAAGSASYSSLLHLREQTGSIANGIKLLSHAEVSSIQTESARMQINSLKEALANAEAQAALSPFRIRAWAAWHYATWFAAFVAVFNAGAHETGFGLFLAIWVWFGLPAWWYAQDLSEKRALLLVSERARAATKAREALANVEAACRQHGEVIVESLRKARLCLTSH
jgi:tetratricopeptide (TPR) repeat protein